MKKLDVINYYFVVQGWMIKLGLKGVDLLIYAIIYNFSQCKQICTISHDYLCALTGASKRTVIRSIDSLEKRNFIFVIRSKDGKNLRNNYQALRVYPLDGKMALLSSVNLTLSRKLNEKINTCMINNKSMSVDELKALKNEILDEMREEETKAIEIAQTCIWD